MRFVLIRLGWMALFGALACPQLVIAESQMMLVCGPSGVGKSTLIDALRKKSDRFVYVTPYTTRPLRQGETDKKHCSYEEIVQLQENNQLIALNQVYGNYYATPKTIIDEAFRVGNYPILDWPIEKVPLMQQKLHGRVVVIYLYTSLDQLKKQLSLDGRDGDHRRLRSGKKELEDFVSGKFDHLIDLSLENVEGALDELVERVIDFYQKLSAKPLPSDLTITHKSFQMDS